MLRIIKFVGDIVVVSNSNMIVLLQGYFFEYDGIRNLNSLSFYAQSSEILSPSEGKRFLVKHGDFYEISLLGNEEQSLSNIYLFAILLTILTVLLGLFALRIKRILNKHSKQISETQALIGQRSTELTLPFEYV